MADGQGQGQASGRARRWRRRSEARPAELMAAALEHFARSGFAGTKLDDVARSAGVTVGTVYRYFPSKEALFEAAVREAILPLVEEAELRIEAYDGPTEQLFRQLMRFAWEHASTAAMAAVAKIVIAEAHTFPAVARLHAEQVTGRIEQAYARLLRRGIERGEFRPLEVEHAARALVAPVLHAALYLHSLQPYAPQPFDGEAYLATATELLLRGLRADDAREARRRRSVPSREN